MEESHSDQSFEDEESETVSTTPLSFQSLNTNSSFSSSSFVSFDEEISQTQSRTLEQPHNLVYHQEREDEELLMRDNIATKCPSLSIFDKLSKMFSIEESSSSSLSHHSIVTFPWSFYGRVVIALIGFGVAMMGRLMGRRMASWFLTWRLGRSYYI